MNIEMLKSMPYKSLTDLEKTVLREREELEKSMRVKPITYDPAYNPFMPKSSYDRITDEEIRRTKKLHDEGNQLDEIKRILAMERFNKEQLEMLGGLSFQNSLGKVHENVKKAKVKGRAATREPMEVEEVIL